MSDTVYIIDTTNDTSYYTEVRTLLGITSNDLTDDELKSDIILGTAERIVCGTLVPNWTDILNGDNQLKADALRSCVIIQVGINILDMPAKQNLIVDKVRLIDIILTAKAQSYEEFKGWLVGLLGKQMAMLGIVHSGGWPDRTLIKKTGTANVYDYHIDTNGAIKKA
jgi:hypothetical protein